MAVSPRHPSRGVVEWHRGGARLGPRVDAHGAAERQGADVSAFPSRVTAGKNPGRFFPLRSSFLLRVRVCTGFELKSKIKSSPSTC